MIVTVLLQSIGGASPRANVDNTTAIFLAMNVSYLEIATKVMNVLLAQENYPVPQPTAAQKSRFIKDVLRSVHIRTLCSALDGPVTRLFLLVNAHFLHPQSFGV